MKACKQCGLCCQSELCPVAEGLFDKAKPPCPGLKFENEKAFCGVILNADILIPGLSNYLKELMGIGKGCDSE